MRKFLPFFVLLTLACISIIPTPPMTVIIENETVPVPTTTLEPRLAIITPEKMAEAQGFQLRILTLMTAGDSAGIARLVKYPIKVNLDGPAVITNAADFESNYERIMTKRILEVISDTSEMNLVLLPEGIRVGQGEVWFNLYCVDLTCSDTQFSITQINN
jgi:hypothetical protein